MTSNRRIVTTGLALAVALALTVAPSPAQTTGGGPLSEEYRLVVGDQIQVVVDGHENLTRDYTLPANGVVSFPPLGKIMLLNKTTEELEQEIAERFKKKEEFTDPNIFVVISGYEPRNAFLIGAITAQIALPVHKRYNIVQILSLASASPATSDLSAVKIIRKRADGTTFEFQVNVNEVLLQGDYDKNVVVMPDDVIYIPTKTTLSEQSYIYVLGKVNSPGRFAYRADREQMTLLKVITMAGDFHQFARPGAIKILRKEGKRTRVREYDFDEIIDGEIQDIVLEPDDVIFVPESPF